MIYCPHGRAFPLSANISAAHPLQPKASTLRCALIHLEHERDGPPSRGAAAAYPSALLFPRLPQRDPAERTDRGVARGELQRGPRSIPTDTFAVPADPASARADGASQAGVEPLRLLQHGCCTALTHAAQCTRSLDRNAGAAAVALPALVGVPFILALGCVVGPHTGWAKVGLCAVQVHRAPSSAKALSSTSTTRIRT
jgi:hypothetical protein